MWIQGLDISQGVIVVANNAVRTTQDWWFQHRRQTKIGPRFGFVQFRDVSHVPMQRDDIGKTAKDSANSTISLSSLAMHDVRLDFFEFPPYSSHATLITGLEPAGFWDG